MKKNKVSNNIIIFSIQNQKNEKKGKNKKEKIKLILSILTIIVSAIAIGVNLYLDKKSEKQSKPELNINMQYYEKESYKSIGLDERGKYLNKVIIEMNDKNLDPVNLKIEPFFNVILYNQNKKALIKESLPIKDIDDNSSNDFLFSVNNLNIKNGIISEIEFNTTQCTNIKNVLSIFSNPKDMDISDFAKKASEAIITSIDLECYIIIDYKDAFDNNYKEIYLCETGYKNFSNYLPGIVYDKDEIDVKDDDIAKRIIEWSIDYGELKLDHLKNNQFNAKVSRVHNNDIMYKEFQELYSAPLLTADIEFYVPDSDANLDELIISQYLDKKLVYILDEQSDEWKVFEN